jgi:hypothetical protein
MSLQSAYQLSCDPEFRGKVTLALAFVCRKIVDENTQTDEGQARKYLAQEILHNVPHYSERAFPLIAADSQIDSSASDEQIVISVRKAVYALVRG